VLVALINFAEKHPQTALMEGAEFLIHEHIQQVGMKSRPQIETSPTDFTLEPKQLTRNAGGGDSGQLPIGPTEIQTEEADDPEEKTG
jgi:hypothetical protein